MLVTGLCVRTGQYCEGLTLHTCIMKLRWLRNCTLGSSCRFVFLPSVRDRVNFFCSIWCRSEPGHHRRVSPLSERRRLQQDHGALPDAEAQERQAEETPEAHRAPPPDPGPDRFVGGRLGLEELQGRGAHTAGKSSSQIWPPFHLDFSSTLHPIPVILTQSCRTFSSIQAVSNVPI